MKRLLEIVLLMALPTLTVLLLWVGSELLIPFIIALVIWYLIISITSAIQKVSVWGWYVPYGISLFFAMCVCGIVIFTIVNFLTNNIGDIITALPQYQARLVSMINDVTEYFGLEKLTNSFNIVNNEWIVSFATGLAQTLTWLAGSMGVIFLYVIFLLLEYQFFDSKLAAMIKDPTKLKKTQRVIKEVSALIQSYIRIKTVLSLITAFASYAVMYFVGVDFASFWAQLIFFLNFIPTIGSIVATILPCLLTILQFESWYPFIIVTTGLTLIQFTIGNIVEPKVIGKSVNLSGLVIIISLAVWGKIWGITGMFLCVPIMVMLNIIFANFEKTRPIAVMLSARGEIGNHWDDSPLDE